MLSKRNLNYLMMMIVKEKRKRRKRKKRRKKMSNSVMILTWSHLIKKITKNLIKQKILLLMGQK
jgi:hypothetical protein